MMARLGLRQAGKFMNWSWRKYVLRQRYLQVPVNDYEMIVDLHTAGVSRPLAMFGTREEDKTAIMRRELKPGMTHMDLGANIGYYALMAAKVVGPKGRVFCVEPDPRNLDVLTRNVALNQVGAWTEIFHGAMSDRVGTSTMFQAHASNLNTLVAPAERHRAPDDGERSMEVVTTTLDEFMSTRGRVLNFLRMDIEGYEVDVLRGGLGTLRDSPAPCKILLETHPQMYGPARDLAALLEQVYSMGFQSEGIVSAGAAVPEAFASRGYKPAEVFHADGFYRGYYRDVSARDTLELVTALPKAVRYLLLSKKA